MVRVKIRMCLTLSVTWQQAQSVLLSTRVQGSDDCPDTLNAGGSGAGISAPVWEWYRYITIPVSILGKPKYNSNTPGEQGANPLPVCEVVIERSSNDGTYGEIAWSPEPHEGSEFMSGNAVEALRITTCAREAGQYFLVLCMN